MPVKVHHKHIQQPGLQRRKLIDEMVIVLLQHDLQVVHIVGLLPFPAHVRKSQPVPIILPESPNLRSSGI